MQDLTGRTIGGYQIIEQIGKGGMAAVFRAYQPSLDRDVAIKVLPPYYAEQDETFLERFKREARAIARLRHPNILMVMDFGQEDDLSYIVMEYVTAGTLKDRLQKPIYLKDIYELTSQIASALQYAHDQGIVHRDVKPSNIMLPKPDWALLTDFGLARMVGGSFLTQSGITVGTPAYMSPEQGSGEKIDHRTDIYALGVMLYEMTVGEVPYTAETPMAVVVKHIVDPLPMPRAKNPEIPEELQRVILKSLAKNPDDRYQQISEIPQALEKIVKVHPDWSASEMKAVNAVREPHVDAPDTKVLEDEDLEAGPTAAPTIGDLPGGPPSDLPDESHVEEPTPEPEALKATVPMPAPASEEEPAAEPEPVVDIATEVIREPQKQKRRLWPFIVGGVAVLAVLGFFIFNQIFSGGGRVAENDGANAPIAEMQEPTEETISPDEDLGGGSNEENIQRIIDLLQGGDSERARQILELMLSRNPGFWGVLMSRVEQLESNGNFKLAANLLQLSVEANPDVPADVYVRLGWLYMENDDPSMAMMPFKEALTREPFRADAYDGLVNSAMWTEQAPDAIEFLEHLAENFPEQYLIFSSLGDLYDYEGIIDQAFASYERAIELEPNDPWVLISAAQAYFYAGNVGRVQELLGRADELAPDDPEILSQVGYTYLDMEQYDRAFMLFQKAHELAVDDPWISLGLAKSIFYTGRDTDVLNDLLRSAEQGANRDRDAWLMDEIGWLYVDMGDCENAVRVFDLVEQLAPGETDAMEGLDACR